MEHTQRSPISRLRLSTHNLAVAGVFGALAVVLSFTPLGLIPVPNPTEAATSLHLPAIVARTLSGPIVGGLVGLVLAAGVAGLVGTLTNTFGVPGLLPWLGNSREVMPVLAPTFSMNVLIEIALALIVTIPTVAALRAVARGRIAAAQD
jgi:uncharacterized membrane protein